MDQLIKTGSATHSLEGGKLKTGVRTLPDLAKDATDRNRTSPFAFTGNKFEFRMVGSRESVAAPNIVLNTIVAEAFSQACDLLESADNFEEALNDLLIEYAKETKFIVYNGNGYSKEWVEEAKRRGIKNLKSMVDAIPVLTYKETIDLFQKFKVFTKAELESREEIQYVTYSRVINIEARTMIDMASKQLLPRVIGYTRELAEAVLAVREVGCDDSVQLEALTKVNALLKEGKVALDGLIKVTDEAALKGEGQEQAVFYHQRVCPCMEALRTPIDKLEMLVDKEIWPMPSYGDLLFKV
jgi:glutamine synthetase